MNKFRLSKGFLLSAALGSILSTPQVYAQSSGDDEKLLEETVVTGSRIRMSPLDQGAPVTTLDTEDLKRTGITSIADILQRMPTSGGALNSRFNSSGNFGFPPDGGGIGAGAAQVDLRHLGSKRVLVLVDGVRWVNGSSASGVSSATDLNTIPNAIIERVEVLEDGASAVYGADAIAGVVNIITKKDYQGFGLEAYRGGFEDGGGETEEFNLSWGASDEDTNMFFSISYTDQGKMLASDYGISQNPVPLVPNCGAGCSSGTPQGRFVLKDPNTGESLNLTINDGVTGIPTYDPANPGGATDDFHPFENVDRFNFSPYNLMMSPVKRWSIFSQVNQQLTSNINFRAKALYNNRESENQAAPEPIFIGPEAGNGNLMDTISVDVTNPYNPFGFTIDAETNPYFIGRRPLEGGPRVFRQNVDTFYASLGFDGEFSFANQSYYWDVTAARSKNTGTQIKTGGYNSRHLQMALGPLDVCEATPGCVPFNIFGGQGNGAGTITPEMLEWVSFIQKDTSQQELFDITANLSGTIVELPYGPLGFAVGYERREQKGFFQPDAVVVAGESAGVSSSPTQGKYDTKERYAEINAPLLAGLPGADLLALSIATRTVDYSTFGSDSSNKLGIRWRPISDLLLRASQSQGLRAPGIGELYGSAARFDKTMNDPCSSLDEVTDQQTVTNCVALGVPDPNVVDTNEVYRQLNPQISVTTGGNSELKPETSESKMFGAVYSPSWADSISMIDDLTFEFTYYDIEIEDAIQALDAEVQLNLCIADPQSSFCNGISRTESGTINGFNNQLINIGGINTSGYDFKLNFSIPTDTLGTFNISWTNSLLKEYSLLNPSEDGYVKESREGTELGDPETSYPEYKSTLQADWLIDQWNVSWTMRYIDEVEESCVGLSDFDGLCSNPNANDNLSTNTLDATFYHDVQATWAVDNVSGTWSVTAGINNVLAEDPPVCFSCALNGFDATTYDVPGRFMYLRLNYRMQ